MSAPGPLIIASLPGRSVAECREQVARAKVAGADLAEIRFDRWPSSETAHAVDLFPSALPLMATLRSRAEGGEGPSDPGERAPLLRALASLDFRYLDLEIARDAFGSAPREPGSCVVSEHLREAPSSGSLARRYRDAPPGAAFVKLVVPATLTQLFERIWPELRPSSGASFVLHTTGPSGPLLRAWAKRLGMFAVYGSLPPQDSPRDLPPVEPSQIPVDRLRPYFAEERAPPIFAVVGSPVDHSASPGLHTRWMQALRQVGLYVALQVTTADELTLTLPHLAAGGFLGVNVTHPWKAAAVAIATRVEPAAETCGCANTLTLRGSTVEADNTDLSAAERRLRELRTEARWAGDSLTVMGAGGAARACLAAANRLGVRTRLLSRRAEVAHEVARQFGSEVIDPMHARPDSLVVNATTVGRAGSGGFDVPVRQLLRPGTHVLDYVYRPEDPVLQDAATAAGATYEDGWRLLVYQASDSFRTWWGTDPGDAEIASAVARGRCTA